MPRPAYRRFDSAANAANYAVNRSGEVGRFGNLQSFVAARLRRSLDWLLLLRFRDYTDGNVSGWEAPA